MLAQSGYDQMSELVFRLTWVCPDCGHAHIMRGPVDFIKEGAAMLVDAGAPGIQIAQEGWAQIADMDFIDWLEAKGIKMGEDVEWGGFRHRKN